MSCTTVPDFFLVRTLDVVRNPGGTDSGSVDPLSHIGVTC
jgi:hypothetical protein